MSLTKKAFLQQAALRALQGILSNHKALKLISSHDFENRYNNVAKVAIKDATALTEAMFPKEVVEADDATDDPFKKPQDEVDHWKTVLAKVIYVCQQIHKMIEIYDETEWGNDVSRRRGTYDLINEIDEMVEGF